MIPRAFSSFLEKLLKSLLRQITLPLLDSPFEEIDPAWMCIHTGDQCKRFSTRLGEFLNAAHTDFFDGLETIRNKSRAHHLDFFDALFTKSFQLKVRVRP